MADKDFVVKNGLVTGTNNVTIGNAVYIVASGNVGIQNSAPAHDLSVNGPSYFGGNIVSSINLSANTTGVYHTGIVNAASHTVGTSTVANATGVYTGIVNAASHTVGTSFTANATLTNTTSLVVSTNTSTFGTAAYIVANGNVGVGTSSPSALISTAANTQVAVYAQSRTGRPFVAANNTVEFFSVSANGNIGVGTSTPNSLLTVVSTGSNLAFNGITGVYNSNQGTSSLDTGGAGVSGYNFGGFGVLGRTNTGIGVVGTAWGNNSFAVAGYNLSTTFNSVAGYFHNQGSGIGVRAIASNGSPFVAANSSANSFVVAANGNIGVGTDIPSVKLDVNGTITATGVYTGVVNAASHTVGTSTVANATGVYTGIVNAASHTVGTSTIANSTGVYTGIVNAASHTVGTSTIANATGVYTTTVNAASHTVGTSTVANATGVYTGVVNAASHTVGTSTIANSTGVYTGVVNATSATFGGVNFIESIGAQFRTGSSDYGVRIYPGGGSDSTAGIIQFTNGARNAQWGSLFVNSSVGAIGTDTSTPFYIKTNGSYKVTVASNGNVGIGTTTPDSLLKVVSNGTNTSFNGITGIYNSNQLNGDAPGGGGAGVAGYNANGYGVFGAANNGTGVIGVANTGFAVAGFSRLTNSVAGWFTNESGGAGIRIASVSGNPLVAANLTSIVAYIDNAGNFVAYQNITAYASDERLKTNFTEIPDALEKVKQLSGYTFDWLEEKCASLNFTPYAKHEHGLKAQEVQKVMEDAVTLAPFDRDIDNDQKSKSGENYLTIRYERLIPLLIQAIKEQQKQIDELKEIIKG